MGRAFRQHHPAAATGGMFCSLLLSLLLAAPGFSPLAAGDSESGEKNESSPAAADSSPRSENESANPSAAPAPTLPSASGFPRKPIRLIVYTGPGGLIDLMARKFADVARTYSPEQPIVVINRPGAGGIVAFEEVLQQPADGYHFLAVTRSNVTKLVSTGREDLLDEVDWFASVMSNPHTVITNRNSGLTSWEAVKADAIRRGGRQLWLGVDIGGVKHVSGLQVWEKAGLDARWIPFGSGGQASAALLGEIGQVYFGNPSDATGNPDLLPVAICAAQRLEDFPDTPTFRELGIEGLENELIWRGFAFRKGTPEPILKWYDDLIRKVDADQDWRSQWRGEGLHVVYEPQTVFSKRIADDRELFRKVLAPLGLLKSRDTESGAHRFTRTTAVKAGLLLALALLGGLVFATARRRRNPVGAIAVAAALVFAAASLLLLSALLPPPNRVDLVGASGVPRLWGVALLLLAAGQLVFLLFRKSGETDAPLANRWFPLVIVVLILYPLLISSIGYFPATLLFFPALLWILGTRQLIPTVSLTLVWLAFAYLVFQRMLQVDLPAPPFFAQFPSFFATLLFR